MRPPSYLLSLLIALFAICPALAHELSGKVVGVSDGDTITLLTAEKKSFKIRLNGIDTPETGQPFGSTAKQFTSKALFGKQVKAVVKDTDRYGRTVAVIFIDGKNFNQDLVKNGYAWWYREYAQDDTSLKQLEYEARSAKIGLWVDKEPIAPWSWRKGTRSVSKIATTSAPSRGSPKVSKPAVVVPNSATVYITNTGVKYHEAGCRHLRQSQIPISLKDAEAQGYTPCKHCH